MGVTTKKYRWPVAFFGATKSIWWAPAIVIADRSANATAIPDGYVVMVHTELQRAYEHKGLGSARPRRLPQDPAVMIWTSGTTCVPKGAWFDHRNLESAVRSAGGMNAPFDRLLVATPFQHAGYMAKIWDQLAWGSCTVISPVPWTTTQPSSIAPSVVRKKACR